MWGLGAMREMELLVNFTECEVYDRTKTSLSFIQKVILKESLFETKKTYAQIAQENNYSELYIKQCVAPKLWKLISEALGEKVNKTNCLSILKQKYGKFSSDRISSSEDLSIASIDRITLELPEERVPLNSPFYIERESTEELCFREVVRPGTFLSITGSQKIGKTSLISRILHYAKLQNYVTVRLSFNLAESEIFSSIDRFLRWFCANVSQQLGLPANLDEYWQPDMGSLVSCTLYFQEYLLANSSHPIVLALDDVDLLVSYPNIERDFLAILRSWYEKAQDLAVWQKLKLVVVRCLQLSERTRDRKSSLGLTIELQPFTREQVEDLAQRHGLQLSTLHLTRIVTITGGLPYLLRIIFYHVVRDNLSLEECCDPELLPQKICRTHLQCQQCNLQQDTSLLEAFRQILFKSNSIKNMTIFLHLYRLGLVRLQDNEFTISCELYRSYFENYLQQIEPYSYTSNLSQFESRSEDRKLA